MLSIKAKADRPGATSDAISRHGNGANYVYAAAHLELLRWPKPRLDKSQRLRGAIFRRSVRSE